MKKNNWIVLTIALVASIVLLAVWFALGFNKVHMLDLVITIVWWVVIAGSVVAFTLIKRSDKNSDENKEQSQSS